MILVGSGQIFRGCFSADVPVCLRCRLRVPFHTHSVVLTAMHYSPSGESTLCDIRPERAGIGVYAQN
jgi:hypothetical protein